MKELRRKIGLVILIAILAGSALVTAGTYSPTGWLRRADWRPEARGPFEFFEAEIVNGLFRRAEIESQS